MPPTQADCDRRDCGTFFLDVSCNFGPGELAIRWSNEPRPTTAAIEAMIEQAWQEQTALASEENRVLYNGQLARLISYSPQGRGLELTLGPVTFREFMGTNLKNARLRYLHGPEVLADPLGVSAALLTSDGYIMLGRRSDKVAFHGGRLHPLGGIVELQGQGQVDPFAIVRDELVEETALPPGCIQEVACIGIVRDKQIVQPEMIFRASVDADAATIRRLAATATDGFEHTEMVGARSESSCLITFIQQNFADLTPVALATLLLHGLGRWGSGWFAAARGYLRKVV